MTKKESIRKSKNTARAMTRRQQTGRLDPRTRRFYEDPEKARKRLPTSERYLNMARTAFAEADLDLAEESNLLSTQERRSLQRRHNQTYDIYQFYLNQYNRLNQIISQPGTYFWEDTLTSEYRFPPPPSAGVS